MICCNPQAKRTLLMRHEAEIKSNAYWLGLLAHLQASSVPRKVSWKSLSKRFFKLKSFLIYSYNLIWSTFKKIYLFFCGCGGQDISCIKDLTSLYEAASIEDVYLAYEQLRVDEDSLYSCVGVAGAQTGDEDAGKDMSSDFFPAYIASACSLSYTVLFLIDDNAF